MNIAQKIIETHKLKFGSLPPLQQCSGSALFNADCMDILPLIPDESVDIILTDPPYNIGYADWDKFLNIPEITKQWYRILKHNGSVFCFAGWSFVCNLIKAMGRKNNNFRENYVLNLPKYQMEKDIVITECYF